MAMKPQDQDRLLIVAISVLCLAALAYGGLALLATLSNRGATITITIKDFDGAAWTQAVGSVGAILVAVWVFNRQSRHTEQQANIRAAAGVRLKSSITKILVEIARVMLAGAYRTWINGKNVRTLPMEPEIKEGLDRAFNDLALTVISLDQFSVADMTCGPEALMWSTARSTAYRLKHLCEQLLTEKADPLKDIESAIKRMEMVSTQLDKLARVVEAGDWDRASSFSPSFEPSID